MPRQFYNCQDIRLLFFSSRLQVATLAISENKSIKDQTKQYKALWDLLSSSLFLIGVDFFFKKKAGRKGPA